MKWQEIEGWFTWRDGQEEAVEYFPEGSCFVEVGSYLGRSLCSLAEVVDQSGKKIEVIGVDTCRGSGPEGLQKKDYHRTAVAAGHGTFAGALHGNIIQCGYADSITLIVRDSVAAARLFRDNSIDWVHLDARHDGPGIKADIHAWLPKIKLGGWLSGDDYNELKWPELVEAVDTLVPEARPWSTYQWRLIIS
jgi:hypothetical protein